MKTEEIEKAAEDYSKEYWREVSGMTNVEESIIYSMDNFKAGVEFADKHWQEKTRWIPVEERLPEHTKRVFIKNNIGNVCCGFYSKSAKMWHTDCEMHYFTHWKEIE